MIQEDSISGIVSSSDDEMETQTKDIQGDICSPIKEFRELNDERDVNNIDNHNINLTGENNTPQKRRPGRTSKSVKKELLNSKSAAMLRVFLTGSRIISEGTLNKQVKSLDNETDSNRKNNTLISETTIKTDLQKVIRQWWEEKVEPDLKQIQGKIKNLERLLLEKEERDYRDEAAATALARARYREILWSDEIVNLKASMEAISFQLEDLKSNLTKENKRVSENL